MTRESEFNLYLVFISIVFGVIISAWVQPWVGVLEELGQAPAGTGRQWASLLLLLRGLFMFLTLICLWWWYGVFLREVTPTKSYMYSLDFLAFGTFAVAARLWHTSIAFPIMAALAAILIVVRFRIVYVRLKHGSKQKKALWRALLVVIVTFTALAASIVTGLLIKGTVPKELLGYMVLFVMAAGICATFFAARVTEGIVWGHSSTPSSTRSTS